MKVFFRLQFVFLLFVIIFPACKKEKEITNAGENSLQKEIKIPVKPNLKPEEEYFVGGWIAKDFSTDSYDEDTVFIHTYKNLQAYKNRTLVLKNDFTYSLTDSFTFTNTVYKFSGNWKVESNKLILGTNKFQEGNLDIKSPDNFEFSTSYIYYEMFCGTGDSDDIYKGFEVYRYNYIRQK